MPKNQQYVERARRADFSLPEFDWPLTENDSRLAQAYNYYNLHYSLEKGIAFVLRYMRNRYSAEQIEHVKTCDPWLIGPVACWIAAIINSGVIVAQCQQDWLDGHIKTALAKKMPAKKVTGDIQTRMMQQAWNYIADLEQAVDQSFQAKKPLKFDLVAYFTARKMPRHLVPFIAKFYAAVHKELSDGLPVESFQKYPKDKLRRQIKFIQSILDGCEAFAKKK